MDEAPVSGVESTAISIVGVGPGDPSLLTIRAVEVISSCSLIVHAGRRDREGLAYEIVSDRIRPEQRVLGAALAMMRGADDGSVGYQRVARVLIDEARAGRRAAFLTEGDPMLYGSGSYVADQVGAIAPDLRVEIVPGVSAISAAAARLGRPLARKHEMLTICPATYHAADIGAILDRHEKTCWLKANDVLPILVEELRARGRLDRAALVENLGRPMERVFLDLEEALQQDLSYFSLVLVR